MAKAIVPERWSVVRRLYEGCELSVAEICTFAGISQAILYQRARRDGWARNRRPGAGRLAPALALLDGGAESREPADRREVARRLWSALDRHLRDLEAGDETLAPARQGQNLMNLARTLERLVEVEREFAETETAATESTDDRRERRGALLAELARRIETMA